MSKRRLKKGDEVIYKFWAENLFGVGYGGWDFNIGRIVEVNHSSEKPYRVDFPGLYETQMSEKDIKPVIN